MNKLKEYFCDHKYCIVAESKYGSGKLYQCRKCGKYVEHFRWIFVDYKLEEIVFNMYNWYSWGKEDYLDLINEQKNKRG